MEKLPKAEPKRKTRVLIADDHTILREGLRKLLEEQGDMSIVGEASNGNECMAMLAELRPDLLLLDLDMPEKDGLAVLEEANVGSAQVIVLTEQKDELYATRAMFLGARCVALKQSPIESLRKCICAVQSGDV